jgi:hypothetical protein
MHPSSNDFVINKTTFYVKENFTESGSFRIIQGGSSSVPGLRSGFLPRNIVVTFGNELLCEFSNDDILVCFSIVARSGRKRHCCYEVAVPHMVSTVGMHEYVRYMQVQAKIGLAIKTWCYSTYFLDFVRFC